MNVLFDSQCSKQALTTSRRILDQFAERKGDRTWQTIEAIALLAAIAGLFHDFGKANQLFQTKLRASSISTEPVRHEWVSLRLFQAFVGGETDAEWLSRLAQMSPLEEKRILANLSPIQDTAEKSSAPFAALKGNVAKIVGWLIVSHHRLPKFNDVEHKSHKPSYQYIEQWLNRECNASWNSPQYDEAARFTKKEWQAVWQFKEGLPVRSKTWCAKAQALAKRAQKHQKLFERDWLQDSFSSHLARLCLMLADHCYSAGEAVQQWQDERYKAYANTDHKTRDLKQKLDEHNLGVGHNAFLLAKNLPKLRRDLPAITRHKGFKQRATEARFRWQDKAFELAQAVAERTCSQGFFGINMASTGCGKTLANARIMYGLADEKLGCRFSIALGLRTLTLQTGDALRQRLHLAEDDLAVLIGSQAVQKLHELRTLDATTASTATTTATTRLQKGQTGSESAEDLYAEHQYLRYDGSLDDGHLSKWLSLSPKLHQLLSAPVLVSTIDHLMPATEGERGGKQIAPMLRLLTSDLVLDEPDDFDLLDLPALCRLVNWAGMLGSRVLLSSATLPPSLVQALFDAYAAGRKVFNQAAGEEHAQQVCCAWFDEFGAKQVDIGELAQLTAQHQQFVAKRVNNLHEKKQVLRKAELLPVSPASQQAQDVVAAMASSIIEAVSRLHAAHHQTHLATGKRVSIGLVRIANIKQMVAIAQHIIQRPAKPNQRIHFCIYHSQHPLIVRSEIEKMLDLALTRYQADALWQVPSIKKALSENSEQEQIFIVFATAVAEVGRDHDYDWAIAEPSSMRSLIQLAGRIQRHRQQTPTSANFFILQQNFRALKGDTIAYTRPGFESEQIQLADKDLSHSLRVEQYQHISAQPRIEQNQPLDAAGNLVDLEHAQLQAKLFGAANKIKFHASLWWQSPVQWCAEIQRKSRFRASSEDEEFVLLLEEEGSQALFHQIAQDGEYLLKERERFQRRQTTPAQGMQAWGAFDVEKLIEEIAEREEIDVRYASRRYAQLRLRKLDAQQCWQYEPVFGVYQSLA